MEGIARVLLRTEVGCRTADHGLALADQIEDVVGEVLPASLVCGESDVPFDDLDLIGGVGDYLTDGRNGLGALPVAGQDEGLLHQRTLLATPA